MMQEQCTLCEKHNTSACNQELVCGNNPCPDFVANADSESESPLPTTNEVYDEYEDEEESTLKSFLHMFTFKGRYTRLRYFLMSLPAFAVIYISIISLDYYHSFIPIFFYIIGMWWRLCISAKRLHDLGFSAGYLVLFIIPVVSSIMGIALLFAKGDNNDNEYGRCPYDED
jgi:uncharacterized membrane protein YhaH (DUF805 family)